MLTGARLVSGHVPISLWGTVRCCMTVLVSLIGKQQIILQRAQAHTAARAMNQGGFLEYDACTCMRTRCSVNLQIYGFTSSTSLVQLVDLPSDGHFDAHETT